VYQFGTEGNASLNALLPFLQQRGIDPAILYNMGNNNGGFFGNNGFESIIALIIVAALFGNNNGGGIFGGGNNSNSAEREMLMSAIQRNGTDLSQLAQTIGCSTSRVQDAVTQVSTQICQLAGQNAMSFQQVINSLQAGNAALASQLCNCCCDIKSEIANTNAVVTRGFSDVGYAFRDQTCNIEKAIAASTAQILEGQRAAEMRDLQDKLDALREKNAQQAVILNNAQQTSQFAAMLAPITEDLASIKCKLPKTEVVNVQPDYIPVNRGVNISYAPYYCGGYNAFGGYGWNGYNNGNCCGNSLWG
jgi:hypothetical protein